MRLFVSIIVVFLLFSCNENKIEDKGESNFTKMKFLCVQDNMKIWGKRIKQDTIGISITQLQGFDSVYLVLDTLNHNFGYFVICKDGKMVLSLGGLGSTRSYSVIDFHKCGFIIDTTLLMYDGFFEKFLSVSLFQEKDYVLAVKYLSRMPKDQFDANIDDVMSEYLTIDEFFQKFETLNCNKLKQFILLPTGLDCADCSFIIVSNFLAIAKKNDDRIFGNGYKYKLFTIYRDRRQINFE